jgi:hypothetical protein
MEETAISQRRGHGAENSEVDGFDYGGRSHNSCVSQAHATAVGRLLVLTPRNDPKTDAILIAPLFEATWN